MEQKGLVVRIKYILHTISSNILKSILIFCVYFKNLKSYVTGSGEADAGLKDLVIGEDRDFRDASVKEALKALAISTSALEKYGQMDVTIGNEIRNIQKLLFARTLNETRYHH